MEAGGEGRYIICNLYVHSPPHILTGTILISILVFIIINPGIESKTAVVIIVITGVVPGGGRILALSSVSIIDLGDRWAEEHIMFVFSAGLAFAETKI